MSDDWPSHNAELTRKTVQELHKWAEKFEAGAINAITWLVVLSALYDTTSGLIDKGISDMIADLHRDTTNSIKRGAA